MPACSDPLSMFVEQKMRMSVFMDRLPVIVDMFMNEVYLEQKLFIFQDVFGSADLLNSVFFRQEGDF